MNAEPLLSSGRLLLLFPLLPVLGIIIISFAKYVGKKQIARIVVPVFTILQAAAGLAIIIAGPELYTEISVSPLDASVRFAFSRERIWVLAAFMVPALFAAGKVRQFGSETLRTVFLFYLAACSGVLVTADIFNFFVFYELMIMSAYVLISVQGKVYASVKYMFVGALSAVFFLTGIIFVYASGLPFSFSAIADLSRLPAANTRLILSFFFMAFCIKSAMFPASPWLPTCHSAGNGTVSSFLSSFTVVSGFFGMYYLVLVPASSVGGTEIFILFKIISLVTMCTSSIFIFFDTDIKRTIAGSTAFIAGFIGYLFATGKGDAAWIYIFVHAVYKSILFHAADDLGKQPLQLKGRKLTFLIMGIALLFAGGIFPSAPHFLKKGMDLHGPVIYIVLYGSVTFLLAGFFKFTFSSKGRTTITWYTCAVSALLLAGVYLLVIYPGYAGQLLKLEPVSRLFSGDPLGYILEAAAVPAALVLGRLVFPAVSKLANLDSRYIFRNLNIEMFALLLLFSAVAVYINVLPLLN